MPECNAMGKYYLLTGNPEASLLFGGWTLNYEKLQTVPCPWDNEKVGRFCKTSGNKL